MSACMSSSTRVAIIGGGPTGLMAAEVLASHGVPVDLFDAMPSLGRKFLLAGVGGLNITHAEDKAQFIQRYSSGQQRVADWLEHFDAEALRTWVHGLGIETFVGSSGRVFPREMKAAPLLRAWLRRLRQQGVRLHTRSRWLGWSAEGALRIASPDGERLITAQACLLALGGASWPKLGSDGSWVAPLQARGIRVNALQPSNCGFDSPGWSEHLTRQAGAAVKNVSLALPGQPPRLGEFILTAHGVEGSLVYALSSAIRTQINQHGQALLHLDLLPALSPTHVLQRLSKPRGKASLARHLQRQLGLDGAKAALLRELAPASALAEPAQLATQIKQLTLPLCRPRPLTEAISTAGGIALDELDDGLMLKRSPGLFCAGEMLDWDAPTGGYLLTACLASGRQAAHGILTWLA